MYAHQLTACKDALSAGHFIVSRLRCLDEPGYGPAGALHFHVTLSPYSWLLYCVYHHQDAQCLFFFRSGEDKVIRVNHVG